LATRVLLGARASHTATMVLGGAHVVRVQGEHRVGACRLRPDERQVEHEKE
jgi:hypothetical protein